MIYSPVVSFPNDMTIIRNISSKDIGFRLALVLKWIPQYAYTTVKPSLASTIYSAHNVPNLLPSQRCWSVE